MATGSGRWRPWLILAGYLLLLAVLIVSMQKIRWLDPGGFEGRYLGTAMTGAWCAGLAVLLLGIVRQHGSRFTLRTLAILIAVIAIYLALCRAVHPVVPTMLVAAGFSVAMLFEGQRIGANPGPFRGRLSRVVMAMGGLMFLAHSLRVLGYLVLIQLGWVRLPSA